MKSKQINNPNSPENLLAPWLLVNMRRHFEIGNRGTASLGRWFLAGILNFADENNKLVEMYRWIESEEGKKFFLSCDPEGHYVLNALSDINESINSWQKQKIVNIPDAELNRLLDEFIGRNFYTFKYQLILK